MFVFFFGVGICLLFKFLLIIIADVGVGWLRPVKKKKVKLLYSNWQVVNCTEEVKRLDFFVTDLVLDL